MLSVTCPKCGADITESHESADPSVGIMSSGCYCGDCDLFVAEDYEPVEGDVPVMQETRDPDKPLGTPISELSGRPGHPGYEAFKRIAASWGYM